MRLRRDVSEVSQAGEAANQDDPMGRYIAHKHRKIRHPKSEDSATDAERSDVIERELAQRREAERLEAERARAAKELRTFKRLMERRSSVVDRTSGRERTAVRLAGTAIVSATTGLRTHGVAIQRTPNSTASELWAADIQFENEDEFFYCFNDPKIPTERDVIHLMRYAAPRLAEEIFVGSSTPGADDKNKATVLRLAESYIEKSYERGSFGDAERRALAADVIKDFEDAVVLRLRHFDAELMRLVALLMRHTRLSRRRCEQILAGVYAGFEASRFEKEKPRLFEAPRFSKAS
jgi:hypothetical protein